MSALPDARRDQTAICASPAPDNPANDRHVGFAELNRIVGGLFG